MTLTIAFRNLLHDRVRLAVTLVGILFSIVLVAVQLGLYLGARRMITSMIDRAQGDLWVMAYATKNFEEAQPINARERYAALATPGVVAAMPLVTSFADWRKPTGGTTLVVVIGTEVQEAGPLPWEPIEGGNFRVRARGAGIGDQNLLNERGLNGLGDTAQIGAARVRVTGLADGIRSFTVSPYVFTTLSRARSLIDMPPDQITYVLVKLAPDADREQVRAAIRDKLTDSEVLTKA